MARCAPDIRAQAIHELIQQDGGPDAVRKLAQSILDTKGSQLGLNTMVRAAMKPTWMGALFQMRINGMLSSPKTHAVNIAGNKLIAMFAIPERAVAAGFSKAFHGGEITFGEVSAQAFGFMQGMRDGMKLLVRGAKAEGSDVGDLYSMFKPTEHVFTDHLTPELFGATDASPFGKALAYAGKVLNVPTNLMGKADDYFKAVGYRMELNALAHRTATNEGLEGEAFIKRFNDILTDPPDDLKMAAFETARYQTFTNDLGKYGQKIQGTINSNYALKFVFPFVRTPTNILKYTFERTPLAVLSSSIRADIKAGGSRAAQAEARIALGSMMLMSAGYMALNGRITGNGSLDPDQRKIAMQTGWQPYSVKVGDRYYAYNRLEPLGMMLGLGADIAEMSGGMPQEDQEVVAMAAAMALAKNLASKTYLSGAFDLMAALDDGNYKSNIDSYIVNQTFTFVPFSSALRGVTRAVDPVLRDAKAQEDDPQAQFVAEFVNSFRKNIPGQSDTLPARRDLWGEVIDQSSQFGFLYDLASPIATRISNPDPVDQVILDNQVSVSWPQRTINGVKLKPQEYAEYSEKAGRRAKAQLDQIVNSPGFRAMSDGPEGMKAEIIKRVISQARKAAQSEMIGANTELRNRIFLKKTTRVQSLVGNGG